jgi:glyoxylase-like metal-dependent hydrolase (beta-lactamase superfamily II)
MEAAFAIGDTEIVVVEDACGPFFDRRERAFVDATPRQWADADAFDPEAVTADGSWLLRFRCFAIRLPGARVILVDTGIGPVDAPAASWAPTPGRLPDVLAEAGIAIDEVDTVVLTHIHTDHIGWAVVDGQPFFGNARYLLQYADVAALRQLNPELGVRLLQPLLAAGQLDVIDGDAALAHGVDVVATPGHTPGHQSVLVTRGADRVLITGDLLVHALQLLHPEIAYAHEVDPDEARRTRVRRLDELADGVLATPHLSKAFVPIGRRPADPVAEGPAGGDRR